ncbi:hypothetical protein CN155_05070 [Sinorhizobium meliloti]|uniref:hypothetical protein n=1 Tax=Rhizobium meliloti TaxID=382 RepID=UPI000FDB7F9F|nr:hypothetical protein [Sinorhizobium meliloti]RVK60629.1 hypothetical protein CN155_05070 [Sinorhizobium meliloti]
MKKAYKFMNSAALPYWLNEHTLRISKVSYFRLLYGSEWIHDPLEVRATNHVNIHLERGGNGSEIGRKLNALGIRTTENTQDIRINLPIINLGPDYFIFSVSGGPFEKARAGMEQAPPHERYDACIMIANLKEFADVIKSTGRIRELDMRPFSDLWNDISIGKVKYVANEADVARESLVQPDPFRKRPHFAPQNEWRLVMAPQDELKHEVLTVQFDPPQGLISEVPWRGKALPNPGPNDEEIVEKIRLHLGRLRDVLVRQAQYDEQHRSLWDARRGGGDAAALKQQEHALDAAREELWDMYEQESDRELRNLYRLLRWKRADIRHPFLDHTFQRPMYPGDLKRIFAAMHDVLTTFASRPT